MLEESDDERLLEVSIDNELKFNIHVEEMCKTTGQKISALARLGSFLNPSQKKTLLESYINSQFNYGSHFWMFCSRKSNNRINRIHERTLRIAYDNYNLSFEDLTIAGSETKHHRGIKKVALEMFKVKQGTCPLVFSEIFSLREYSSTRSGTFFNCSTSRTTTYGIQSLRTFGPKIWNEMLPTEMKILENIDEFKTNLTSWKVNCDCRLCLDYVGDFGFVQISN